MAIGSHGIKWQGYLRVEIYFNLSGIDGSCHYFTCFCFNCNGYSTEMEFKKGGLNFNSM